MRKHVQAIPEPVQKLWNDGSYECWCFSVSPYNYLFFTLADIEDNSENTLVMRTEKNDITDDQYELILYGALSNFFKIQISHSKSEESLR